MFNKFCRFSKPLAFSFSEEAAQPVIPYKKNLEKFFNHLIKISSQTPWKMNNVIYEDNDSIVINSIRNQNKQRLLCLLPCFATTFGVHYLINPYLTIIPMFFTVRYFFSYITLTNFPKKMVKKIEIINKDTIHFYTFSKEKPDVIDMKSLRILEIQPSNGFFHKRLKVEGINEKYIIEVCCNEQREKDKLRRNKFYYMIMKNEAEEIGPKEKLEVLKAVFTEAECIKKLSSNLNENTKI